jgi:hypothetical protein
MQLLGRRDNAPRLCRNPEIEKVMVIEPLHAGKATASARRTQVTRRSRRFFRQRKLRFPISRRGGQGLDTPHADRDSGERCQVPAGFARECQAPRGLCFGPLWRTHRPSDREIVGTCDSNTFGAEVLPNRGRAQTAKDHQGGNRGCGSTFGSGSCGESSGQVDHPGDEDEQDSTCDFRSNACCPCPEGEEDINAEIERAKGRTRWNWWDWT